MPAAFLAGRNWRRAVFLATRFPSRIGRLVYRLPVGRAKNESATQLRANKQGVMNTVSRSHLPGGVQSTRASVPHSPPATWRLRPWGRGGSLPVMRLASHSRPRFVGCASEVSEVPGVFSAMRAWLRAGSGLLTVLAWLCMPALSYALCGLNEAVLEQIGSVKDPEAARA